MKESWHLVGRQTTLRSTGLTVKSYITTITIATAAAPIAIVSAMTTGRNLDYKLSQCRLLLGLRISSRRGFIWEPRRSIGGLSCIFVLKIAYFSV